MDFIKKPESFLKLRIHDLSTTPSLTGLCVGYEKGEWRASQFANHIMEWLPEFALKSSECSDINSANSVQLLREAAKRVYESKKFENRGEFGELFLHAAIRQVFNSQPAISKIFYKSSINDTVKGFDAVHVVEGPDGLELWLGEAKFYNDIGRAIRDVVDEIKTHTQTDYLRNEFLLIKGKIDPAWSKAASLDQLLSRNTSLDEIFSRACIPVLLTYDSDCVEKNNKCDKKYEDDFEKEIRAHHHSFASKDLPSNIVIHLFLLPLKAKKVLLAALDEKLKTWQNL